MNNEINEAVSWINEADGLLVTASNGLSISEGYHIFADNDDFKRYFGYFRDKYGIDSIINGVFARLPAKEQDKFMEILRKYMIEDYMPSDSMNNLKKLIGKKEYFILTSNADTHFQLSGFDADRLFEIEGNFAGDEMYSENWQQQKKRYESFIIAYADKNLVLLELGIGMRNRLIKAPTMEMVANNGGWKYITLNLLQEIFITEKIKDKSIAIAGDIAYSLDKMVKEMN